MSKIRAARTDDAIAAAVAPRDGPTPEFARHHRVLSRGGRIGGYSSDSRLRQWARSGDIAPQDCDAGERFSADWALSVGRQKSSLNIEIAGQHTGSPADSRMDAAKRLRGAVAALDGAGTSPLAPGHAPSKIVTLFAVHDRDVVHIARQIGIIDTRKVKRMLVRYLATLSSHYDRVDAMTGRSRTAFTLELLQRRSDPDLVDDL